MQYAIIFKRLVILLFICIGGNAFSEDNYSVILRYNSGLYGSTVDKNEDSLQPHGGIYEKEIEIQYRSDNKRDSFFFGGGYSHLEKNYILFLNGIGPSLDYQLNHHYIFGRVGYSIALNNFYIKPSFKLGSGNYTLKGDKSINESGNAMIYGIDLNFEGHFFKSHFLYQFGLGYSRATYNNFEHNNVDVESNEINQNIKLNIGIGYSF